MSSGSYALGLLLLAVVAGGAALVGRGVQRALLPEWEGPPAVLVRSISGVAVVILSAEALGSVGGFRRWPLVGTLAILGLVAAVASSRRVPRWSAVGDAPRTDRAAVAVAAAAVAVAATRALQGAVDAWHAGMFSYDTLWYHLPFAAGFVQRGSLTHLQYVGNDPTTFYPANGEVVHAIGMLLFRSDVLSPAVNLGWLALALLAAWCVGRPFGVAPATTVAMCVVAFLPVMGGAQAGSAGTDVAVLALLASAAALVVDRRRPPAAIAIAALAAGLAAGTKLDASAIALALGAAVVVSSSSRRGVAALLWITGIVVGSGFWYLRNLVRVGNPFPWFGAFVGLPTGSPPSDCGTRSLAHYLPNTAFVSRHILPQLPGALGARWWLVAALAAVGLGSALVSPHARLRAVAVVGLVGLAAFVVTPATAGGHAARCFGFNTRFATPPLVLGLLLLPPALAAFKGAPRLSVIVLTAALVLTIHPSHEPAPQLGVLFLLTATLVFAARRRLPRPAGAALAAATVLAVALAGLHEQKAYARDRYRAASFSDPVAPIARRLRDVRDARIAVVGIAESYPLYGPDLSNRVGYPARRAGARFHPYPSCAGWLSALRRGRYDYVVTASESTVAPVEASWTKRYPGSRTLLASPPGATNRGSHWTWQAFRLGGARPIDALRACLSAR
jgi:hypothetical protein